MRFDYTIFLETLENTGECSVSDSVKALTHIYHLLCAEETYGEGVKGLATVLEFIQDDELVRCLASDCIGKSRIFHYKNILKNNSDIDLLPYFSPDAVFQEAFYSLGGDLALTIDQIDLLSNFQTKRRMVVSAPTSFGKSMLITQIIRLEHYKNIAIIVPTKALLYETFNNLFSQPEVVDKYTIINNKQPNSLGENNIVVLTPERMDAFLDDNPDLQFDFFVMDEIYKVNNEDDDRSKVFSTVLYRMCKMKCDFYLIGPYFQGFSQNFLNMTNSHFKMYSNSVVQKKVVDVYGVVVGEEYFADGQKLKKYKTKEVNLKQILRVAKGSNLIYSGSKRTCESIAKLVANENLAELDRNHFVDYLEENFYSDWSLIEFLKKGVSFHHGSLPRFIQVEIINLLNRGDIKTIVCTPTIIEGVNTSARNVYIMDTMKGPKHLTELDIKNIKGRAGRFSTNFYGNIYLLEYLDMNLLEKDTGVIDHPLLDNDSLAKEDTLLVDIDDLDGKNKKTREDVELELLNKKIPLSLVKKNKYIPYQKQLLLIRHLQMNPSLKEFLLTRNTVRKEQLDEILTICRSYIFTSQDLNDKMFNWWDINKFTKYYVYLNPSLKELCDAMPRKSSDSKIRAVFHLMNHYFEFSLPRYLKAFENLFNFSYNLSSDEGLSLGSVVTKLEYGCSEEHEILLKEIGLPGQMISKVSKFFSNCSTTKAMYEKAVEVGVPNKLHPYERQLYTRLLLKK